MTETITLELPEKITASAQQLALRTQRRFEDVLLDWLNRGASAIPVDMLSEDQIRALAESELTNDLQIELSDLLHLDREGMLDYVGQMRLDELMRAYRTGLLRKAEAIKIAVERGFRAPLN